MAASEQEHWWFVSRREIFAELLRTLAPPAGASIVDLGCGTGGNLNLLGQFGDVTGLELNPEAAVLAAAHGRVVVGGATHAWPIAENSVQLFTAFDVLEHIADEYSALANLFSSLVRGGILILSVPAYQWLWSGHDVALHHQRRYVLRDIVKLAAPAGFSVEYASYHNCLLFPVACMLRGISRLSAGRIAVDENHVPAQPLNRLLRTVYRAERHIIKHRWRMPFGLSIIAVFRKPQASGI